MFLFVGVELVFLVGVIVFFRIDLWNYLIVVCFVILLIFGFCDFD